MSGEMFKSVVEGLCQMYKLDPAPVLEGGVIEMGKVNFCLLHNQEVDSPLITVYAEFGKIPKELEAQAHKKLLEANLTSYTGQGETFCLAPDGGVVFATNYPLEVLTPVILAGNLALIAIAARNWRDNYMLDVDELANMPTKKNIQNALLLKQSIPITK